MPDRRPTDNTLDVRTRVTCTFPGPKACISAPGAKSKSYLHDYQYRRTDTQSRTLSPSAKLRRKEKSRITQKDVNRLSPTTQKNIVLQDKSSSPSLGNNKGKEARPVIVKVARRSFPESGVTKDVPSDRGISSCSDGAEEKGPTSRRESWFSKLSRPVFTSIKKKVNETFHKDGNDCDQVSSLKGHTDTFAGEKPQEHGLQMSCSKGNTGSALRHDIEQVSICHSAFITDEVDCTRKDDPQKMKQGAIFTRPNWYANEDSRHRLKKDCNRLFLVVDLPRKVNTRSKLPVRCKTSQKGGTEILCSESKTLSKSELLRLSCKEKDATPDWKGNNSCVKESEVTEDVATWKVEDRDAVNRTLQRRRRARQEESPRDQLVEGTVSQDAPHTEKSSECPDESDKENEWGHANTDSKIPLTIENAIDHFKTDSDSDGDIEDRFHVKPSHEYEEDVDKIDCATPPLLRVPTYRKKSPSSLNVMIPLYQGRVSVLQAEKQVLLDMNSTLRSENEALRRVTRLLARKESTTLDVEQNATTSNGEARPSEASLLPRLSHGRLPSLATLTRINLRFNREHHGCLHRAVLGGKEDDVEALLSAGKDINAHDEYGKTPLHCAVGAQKLDIVQCLLSHRPDVDAHDDRDDTPLHTAVRTGNIDIVTALLKEGHADSNSVGNGGCTPLHVAAQLEHVNNVAICKLLLDHNSKLLLRDHKWMTPLAHAALHGSYDVMVCLFHNASSQGILKDDLLFEVDGVGSTLLHLAVESGSARVVELCLDEGAAPHSVKSQDGSTPVHLACSYGYMDILDILMKAVAFILDPPPDQDGMLPIHRAAQSNHHEVIAYLLKQDVDQIDSVDHLGRTSIMLAAENNCIESVRVLLDHGANVDIRDSDNKTVLHYAIGGVEVLKEILKDVKANSLIRAKDRHGNTPGHYASRHGCTKDVSIILMKYKAAAAITNGMGEIPLHIASRYGWLAVVKKLTEGRGKRTMNSIDANERTPLHLAAREGHDELVEFFLKRGARIDRDVHGQTPLHYAAFQGSKKSLELILENKADCLNVTDKNQNTALHMAAMGGHAEILKFLLSKPDQIVSVNERNQNPLDIAIEAKHETVAMAIAENDRWKEVVRSTVHGTHTQIQLLVRHMPEVAKKFLDRCVVTKGDPDDEDYKVSYDFRFIQGMPDDHKKIKNIRESLIALHTMVKYERLECLTHPLCSVLMDIKWRKFGLVCAFLNQGVYLIYISLIMVIMNYIVSVTKENVVQSQNATTVTSHDPLIVKSFKDKNELIAVFAVVLIIACVYNLAKEFFQMFDEGWKYFFSVNNWLEVTLYVMTFVTIVGPLTNDLAALAVCVFLAWIVLLHYISKFNYVGLYVVMIRKTVLTVCKVLIILIIFLAAFAFSFHVITVPLTKNVTVVETRFNDLSVSLVATFFMILDNLRYDEIVLASEMSDASGVVLYGLFIAYCVMMPIIFLNLLIGLAVGDIDNIRKTAAMERYTSQVEHLSQLERALPAFILSKVQVAEYVEHPNRQKNLKDKIVNLLVMLLSPRQEHDKKHEDQTNMEERVQRHEAQLKEISSMLRKHSVLLEEMRDLLQEKRKQVTGPREGEETESVTSPDSTEFFV